jgi:GTP-binding protein HflX
MALFQQAIAERVSAEQARGLIELGPAEGRLRARFYALGDVLQERVTAQGRIQLTVELPARELAKLYRHEGLEAELIPLTDANLPVGAVAH